MPILLDSGVRTATDILRARCLGASAVMLGRPPLWALACGGAPALAAMLHSLHEDLVADMQSLGVTSLEELGPQLIWRAAK